MNRKLFEDIDARLLYGFKCSESSQVQQNYFERLKIQTESAFNNRKYVQVYNLIFKYNNY